MTPGSPFGVREMGNGRDREQERAGEMRGGGQQGQNPPGLSPFHPASFFLRVLSGALRLCLGGVTSHSGFHRFSFSKAPMQAVMELVSPSLPKSFIRHGVSTYK